MHGAQYKSTIIFLSFEIYYVNYVSTTPLQEWGWGFRNCLRFSWTTLRGKHCRHPFAIIVVVDTCGPGTVTIYVPAL